MQKIQESVKNEMDLILEEENLNDVEKAVGAEKKERKADIAELWEEIME